MRWEYRNELYTGKSNRMTSMRDFSFVKKNRFYDCKICNGKGFIRHNKYPHPEDNINPYPTERCIVCNKTGKTAKKAV